VLSHFFILEAEFPHQLIERGMTVKLEEEFRAPAFVWKLIIQFYPGREIMEEWLQEAEGGDA
jgi:hypothetical protein